LVRLASKQRVPERAISFIQGKEHLKQRQSYQVAPVTREVIDLLLISTTVPLKIVADVHISALVPFG